MVEQQMFGTIVHMTAGRAMRHIGRMITITGGSEQRLRHFGSSRCRYSFQLTGRIARMFWSVPPEDSILATSTIPKPYMAFHGDIIPFGRLEGWIGHTDL